MFDKYVKDNLIWFPEKGIGYYPVKHTSYDERYFNHYVECADTEMGRNITSARIDLVTAYYAGMIVDVGIGCGQFVEEHGNAFGYDVNPVAVDWLNERSLYLDVYKTTVDAATFWDSLEHIHEPDKAIARVNNWVFLSLPIFSGPDDVIGNKHFKKNEHVWYFTHYGLIHWFDSMGFDMIDFNNKESFLGRQSIQSYAFRRQDV